MFEQKIILDAEKRYKEGEKTHGVFDPATDKRDMLAELYQEILDALNYLDMYVRQMQEQHIGNINLEFCRKVHLCKMLLIEAGKEVLDLREGAW